ncbi:MAG: DMT family transporter [Gammaproteobacteria bacterium]|nr:DMT family transporter [Gammaproteobacteria bacterium]
MLPSSNHFGRAVVYILLAILLFDLQGVIIKFLGERYPVQQLAAFRNVFGLIPSILVLLLSSEWHARGRQLKISQWRLGLVRGLCIAGAQFCFYLSITKMELATASTLTYISPVLITMLSIPILKHQVGLWRWIAVFIGFVGVLMIMAPGSEVFTPYSLLPIGAALGYSLSTVCVRLFDEQIPTALINMYASVGALLGTLAIVVATTGYLQVESAQDWLLLIAMGFVGGFAVLALINAYRLTRPANLSPYEYFGIPFAFVLGWIFFDEAPFEKLIPGVFLIVMGGMLIAWRERRKRIETAPVITE